jgi:protein-S-isoprenylcysteine O-methyltransferase Ste14
METSTTTPSEKRTTTLQVGGLKLQGGAAIVALLVIVAAIVAVFVWRGLPRWPVSVSAVLWLVFITYWSAMASRAAPTKSAESAASRRTHVRLMNGALILLFIPFISLLGRRFLPDSLVFVVLGLAIQIGAGALGVWARRHLGRNWSGAITVAEDHQLVRSGPYRRLRHPIYSAMIGMFVGSTVAIGEWHSLLGLALIVIAYARKIPLEERSLRGVFGPAYDEYCKSSWALIPGVF